MAVSTKSQYIVASLMSSGNLSDSKAAIPLLKKVGEVVPNQFTTAIFDAGYDYEAIYRQINHQSRYESRHSLCETDIRKYTYPARGSALWDKLYKERTAVERVNAYLKEYFQLNNVRHRTGRKAKLHFQLVTFIYNACKLAVDRMNVLLQAQQQVA